MKNSILLIVGLVVTVLFLLFPAQVFELGYYEREFSNEMYNENLYLIVAVVTALMAWIAAGAYYYLINSVSFSRWYHWLMVLGGTSVLSAIVNYVYPSGIFTDLGYDFSGQLFSFCVFDLVVTAVLYVIASFAIRWWSSNCRHTPFPE
ncbi:MAG: hypothetical protein KA067_02420 [Prevotella sp.]|nr:hypothetical protein [Prevotella sp.]